MKGLPIRLAALLFLLLPSIVSFSQQKKSTKRSHHASVSKPQKTAPENEHDLIKNGITFKSNGFKVSEAYLFFDDENPVPEGNTVALNKNVNMVLIIDSGWTEVDGRVFPGSKQTLKLSNGVEISDTEELFAAFNETGVSPDEARYVTLNTVVSELRDKKKHVIVNFRLWDKKGTAEISGSYKLYIK